MTGVEMCTAEVTDPISGEVTVLQAGSETELDAQIDRFLTANYPLPINSGAGSVENAATVRAVMRVVTGLVGSTRLLDVRNQDGRPERIEIGCATSRRFGDPEVLAQLERRLLELRLDGLLHGRWQTCWHPSAGALLLTRNP